MNTHETYVSLETAKLLKEAGFDWKCNGSFISEDGNQYAFIKMDAAWDSNNSKYNQYNISAPTLAVTQKWLREVKNMPVNVISYSDTKTGNTIGYCYQVYERTTGWVFNHFSYESALEAGIKKALEIILEKEE